MARKITIRRVGGLLPAVSLVVLVLLASLFIWLSTAGLPDCALRKIEEEAARRGIYLRVDKIRLAPASGLAVRARRVALYASAEDAAAEKAPPLARLRRATAGISLMSLLRGQVQLTMAELHGLTVNIPTDGEAPLVLDELSASAAIRNGRYVRLTSAHARLEGIPIKVTGAFMLPEMTVDDEAAPAPESDDAPIDIAALLRPWQEEAGRIQRSIARQDWTPEGLPAIELRVLALKKTQLSARIQAPRYDEEQFHFRDVLIDVAYRDNTVLLNQVRFRTVEPESEVSLQGGYDIPARHLSFNLESSAALTRMAEAIEIPGVDMEVANEWLRRFQHPDDMPPTISLRGDIHFEEDFSLKAISVLGQLNQKNFTFGQTPVDELSLSFFYQDGRFNIDHMQLVFPHGSITASASAFADKGKASIQADLDVPRLLGFINEFTSEPLSLPDELMFQGNLQLEISAELDIPTFTAGATQLNQFLPALHQVHLALGIEKASHFGCTLEQPRLELNLDHFLLREGSLLPHALDDAQLSFRAAGVTLPPGEDAESRVKMGQTDLSLHLQNLSLDAKQEAGEPSPHIGSLSGKLHLGSLTLPNILAEAVELELNQAEDIRPLAQNWRQMVRQASLRLNTGAMHTGETLLGAMDSKLALSPDGDIDLTLVLDRDGHRLNLDLHPRLQEDGLLVLNAVQMELPAAGFAPLLALAGVEITQIRLPDSVMMAGNASIDTQAGYLRDAQVELNIPHLVRTPGDGIPAFRGMEIPLSVHIQADARGREDGHVNLKGKLAVTHKGDFENERKLLLDFSGDTATHLHFEGSDTIDVNTVDALIDNMDAHVIMRDFHADKDTRMHIAIHSVDVDYREGLTVTASCDARLSDMGYQMNAMVEEKGSDGKPTGRERLRKDFGKVPFRSIEKAQAHVDVLYKENAEGKTEDTRISILDADITYDNRPWLRSNGFKNGVKSSRLQGDAIIIDVEKSFVELRNVRGQAYPAYAIGAYYDELPGFLETLIFEQPAELQTEHCLFPIYDDCPYSMSGSIRVEARKAGFRFLGTTFPLSHLSGFIWFKDGAVCLDRLNAACWDGAVNAALVIDYSGKRTGFDGYANINNVNLKPLAAAYGSNQQPALCQGNIRFRTPTPELEDIQAYGEVHIVDGDLLNLSIFRPVGDLISDLPGNLAELERKALRSKGADPTWIDRQLTNLFKGTGDMLGNMGEQVGKVTNNIPFANHFLRYDLQEVHSSFTIGRGILSTQGLKALGYNLNVGMQMNLDLDKLTLDGALWPKISSVPTVILSPLTFLSDFMIDIHVFGPVDDIQWKFGLNKRNKKNGQSECSATSEEQEQPMQPGKR